MAGSRSGWAAIIQDPIGSDFREFAIVYHEVGNERYRHLNKSGGRVPLVDELTAAYKPGSRALNYRSEPFRNRLQLQQETFGFTDPSQAYSSYVFGDPATPIARAYLGDPVKQRVVHGGSEVFHVHHVHGGAIYHEVGNERYRHLNKSGGRVPLVDELTAAYKPGSRALNYRSEPFRNRLQLQQETFGFTDPSQAYSSYVFGDPATPIARAYLGDPVKQRVVHGGSEVFHVHHVHGAKYQRNSLASAA